MLLTSSLQNPVVESLLFMAPQTQCGSLKPKVFKLFQKNREHSPCDSFSSLQLSSRGSVNGGLLSLFTDKLSVYWLLF